MRKPRSRLENALAALRARACDGAAAFGLAIGLALAAAGSAPAAAEARDAKAEDWLCTQESSRKLDGVVLACGVGRSRDEADARGRAFDAAQAEFRRVCDLSQDCRGRGADAEPKRTTCSRERSGEFACYRLIQFNLADRAAAAPSVASGSAPAPRAPSSSSRPRLKQNISKSEAVAILGPPSAEVESDYQDGRVFLYFRGPACLVENSECSVTVDRGSVVDYRNFKPDVAEEIR